MSNEKEIEAKLLFKDKNTVISALGKNIKFQKTDSICDVYFGKVNQGMENSNNLIRIRTNKKEAAELTYKGKTKDKKNVWHRTELTVEINSPQTMKEILNNLGYRKISEHESEKEYWNYNGLEICFAKFTKPAYLEFMEIEGKSEKRIREAIKKLKGIAKEVGEEIFEVFDKKRNNLKR